MNRPASVSIPDSVIADFLKPAHIARANAEALFTEADAVDSLPLADDPEGKSIVIVERHVKGKMSQVHLLGIGFSVPGGEAIAHVVLKIPPALRNDNIVPIETLKRMLDAFGATVSVGVRTGKIIIGERIEIAAGGGNLVNVSADPGHSFHNGMYIRMTKAEDGNYADCALCFALDTTLYRQSISN